MSAPAPPTALTAAVRRDVRMLFLTRVVRLFAYGMLSVVLVLYLARLGLQPGRIGLLLTLTLLGDTLISMALTTHADRLGRRRTLIIGAALMVLSGGVFAVTRSFPLLLLAATIGVISPSGNEVGPFLAVEQAGLAQLVPGDRREQMVGLFAWYNLAGSLATASGALFAGLLAQWLGGGGLGDLGGDLGAYRILVLCYAALGGVLCVLFVSVSAGIEVPQVPAGAAAGPPTRLGLHRSRGVVLRLAALFTMDAFAGGFVVQSATAYWFHLRYGASLATLGAIFFGGNLLAGVSALLAARLAARIGLLRTMVFTHVPSNILLILVPLMPNLTLSIAMLLLRFSISQMDVPTRQAYTMAVVAPDERSAAAGITGIARTTGAALAPLLAVSLIGSATLASVPFFIAGGLKLVYDLLLYRSFRRSPASAAS